MVSSTDPGRGDSRSGLALRSELLLSLPAGVAYVAGPDLIFEFANDEYRRYVGGRDLIGLPLGVALPELARERLETVARVGQQGQPFQDRDSEVWIRRRGQELEQMFVDLVYQPVPDDAGGVAGVLICVNDVTAHVQDRRRLEVLAERLATTEERYRTLFETLPLGVVHHNADGSILWANPAAGEILGRAPDAMTTWPRDWAGRAVHEDGSPFQLDELPVVVALRTGEVVADVVAGLPHGRTGELRWLQVTAVPDARDEQGRPQRAYAMLTDITEQRRAEAALRQSNRLLGRLREANVLGVLVVSEEGIHEANDAFLDIIGYTRDDLESGRIHWRTITPPRWAARDDDALEQLRRTGAFRPFEKEYVRRDGHRVPVLLGAAVIGWHPLRWTTFVVDLTARQRREQERARLLAREQAARREAGTARERLAFLQQAGELTAAARNRDDLLEQVTQLVELAATPGDDSLIIGARAGSVARQAQEGLTVLNAGLEERVTKRTSELVRAEADRRALEAELRKAERLQTVGQLTRGIAHDFKNLLGIIVGYAEMAEDISDYRDPELHQILREISVAADRAVHLSSDLLSFSSRARTKPEAIDLNALIDGIRHLLTVSMSGSAKVLFEPWPAALPAVLADRGQLEQVLFNLAVNARDAMPEGGTLTIRTRIADLSQEHAPSHPAIRRGRYVELAVSDTGIGMSADVRRRIFERFFTTKPPGKGTGLGLSTVHGIITDIGGTIEVDSKEGHGTTFRVYLPATADPVG
jgi:two-component system cell cycle sensor histidine kinase/response regulator CckA